MKNSVDQMTAQNFIDTLNGVGINFAVAGSRALSATEKELGHGNDLDLVMSRGDLERLVLAYKASIKDGKPIGGCTRAHLYLTDQDKPFTLLGQIEFEGGLKVDLFHINNFWTNTHYIGKYRYVKPEVVWAARAVYAAQGYRKAQNHLNQLITATWETIGDSYGPKEVEVKVVYKTKPNFLQKILRRWLN